MFSRTFKHTICSVRSRTVREGQLVTPAVAYVRASDTSCMSTNIHLQQWSGSARTLQRQNTTRLVGVRWDTRLRLTTRIFHSRLGSARCREVQNVRGSRLNGFYGPASSLSQPA